MTDEKIYKMICEAKDMMDEYEDELIYDTVHVFTDDFKRIMKDKQFPIRLKIALLTVLLSGVFKEPYPGAGWTGDGYCLPTTVECCRNYKRFEKQLKSGRPFVVPYYSYTQDYTNPEAPVVEHVRMYTHTFSHYPRKNDRGKRRE